MDMMRVAIVEDDPKAAGLLTEYIRNEDIEILALYGSGEEALEALESIPKAEPPDVILMDVGLPGMNGIETTRLIKERWPKIEIIVQTVFEDAQVILDAIKAGASGYILKASPREDYLKSLRDVMAGGSFLSGKVAKKVLLEFSKQTEAPRPEASLESYALTSREEEIMRLLVKGDSYKQIAAALGVSVFTVNNHTRKIYEKLRVNSRGEAVAKIIKA